MSSIKFGNTYTGEWIYNFSEGVGLKFEGIPTSEKLFVEFLQNQSCSPVMSHMICDTLLSDGIRYSTVMSSLNFEKIYHALHDMGVKMTIVPPRAFIDGGLLFDSIGAHRFINVDDELLDEYVSSYYDNSSSGSIRIHDRASFISMMINNTRYLKKKMNDRKTSLGLYQSI